ncbi:unnamed protein product [Staurois parvus]|uniref:Glyoxalase domain-containing protein n=1 Tax=Staurois parvus TaxID=386267 RepID=A0ABN9BK10_9NEOB|nr:unnamed protein product [Staurois parvus]
MAGVAAVTQQGEGHGSSPYDGKWSKTMIGYGSEDNHFVVELTYNYGIGEYCLGNDFLGLTLQSSQAVANAKQLNWPLSEVTPGVFETEAPGGYKFYLEDKAQPSTDPVQKSHPCRIQLKEVNCLLA